MNVCLRCKVRHMAWNDPMPYPLADFCADCEEDMQQKAWSRGGTVEQIASLLATYKLEWRVVAEH